MRYIRTPLIFILLLAYISISAAQRPKVGLVLSGGGARGLAHIGTIILLDSLKIPIDYIAGTSMGGIIGALYAAGYSGEKIQKLGLETDWNEVFTDRPARNHLPFFQKQEVGKYQLVFGMRGLSPIMPTALIRGQKISLLFSRLTLDYANVNNFKNLPIPFCCIAVDLVTGNEVVLQNGSLAKAMRSTMSLPTIFSPVEWGDSLLVDGGLSNNLPTDVMKKMGADIIVAVDVGEPFKGKEELQSIVDIFERSFFITGQKKSDQNKKLADILITPDLENVSPADFDPDELNDIFERGYKAAKNKLNELLALKQRLRFQEHKEALILSPVKNSSAIIFGVEINGYDYLPFSFIYNSLSIRPGETLNIEKIENGITELYALGYFETISYETEPSGPNSVILKIQIKEKPAKQLKFGLRYDDFHELVGVVSLQGTDILIPGLRLENELQFAGILSLNLRALFPSRGKKFPLYPFLEFNFNDEKVNIYSFEGPKIASYKDKSATLSAGIGLTLGKSWNIETWYNVEYMNIKPGLAFYDAEYFPEFNDELHKLNISTVIDRLDDVLLPRHGSLTKINYEGSFKNFGSESPYTRFDISTNIYHTYLKKHTFILYGFYGRASKNVPIYKLFHHGGPETFVGLDYTQLISDRLTVARFEYRYELFSNVYVKFMANAAFEHELRSQSFPTSEEIVTGYGMGMKFLSILGPFEFVISRGDLSPYNPGEKELYFYFKAGYKF